MEAAPRRVMSVLGPVEPQSMGVTDAHNHVWIEAVEGADPKAPVLTQREAILSELIQYRQAGGGGLVDCQPGGCGRNAAVLEEFSRTSHIQIVACTGFHRRRYYPPDFWLWRASPQRCADYFVSELRNGTQETLPSPQPVKAGFVKAAFESTLEDTELGALEGAAGAVLRTGAALLIHTERGQAVEALLGILLDWGVRPGQIILCHMDKRPDLGLHAELAQEGVLLEYDTFYRPLYQPELHLWLLIAQMAAAGLGDRVALATDMAPAELWRSIAKEPVPGLPGFPELILRRLRAMGLSEALVRKMGGANVALRLATF
jgi:5-phospho-D-xylono-1,4-lactonase